MSATQAGSNRQGNHNMPSFHHLPPQIQRDPTENEHYEKLYQVTKQLYKRHTKLITQHSQLQRNHNLMKTKYIELKAELLLKQELLYMYENPNKTS